MNFQKSIDNGYVKKIPRDLIRFKSLIKSSSEAILTAKKIIVEPITYKTIIRELYEGLREYCEALSLVYGYKIISHEAITYFIEEILKEEQISARFDKYRKLRNGINYYGNDVAIETVREALKEIPELIRLLKKYEK